ncbi:hypothetical protein L2E82_14061 [Cichorium intybus]|uniref:Uncharacterized protein n=1 Tax=Cichorium intybus TaxID=13427 RepID=A0ACB9EZC2_CICIN|nr:hypothetical protein L2E82_14061 [Cichorium intybus]
MSIPNSDLEVEEHNNDIHSQSPHPALKRHDSLDIEAAKFRGHRDQNGTESWRVVLKLAFQSLGVVYGDLGTSPRVFKHLPEWH